MFWGQVLSSVLKSVPGTPTSPIRVAAGNADSTSQPASRESAHDGSRNWVPAKPGEDPEGVAGSSLLLSDSALDVRGI